MMLLFRASGAGEGWQDIMLSCQKGADCDPATVVPGTVHTEIFIKSLHRFYL